MVSWFTARAAAAPVAADIATSSAQVSGSRTLVPNLWARGSGPCIFRSLRGVRGWAMSSEKFEKWVQNAVLVSGPENGPRFIDHKHKSITAGPFLSPFFGLRFWTSKTGNFATGFSAFRWSSGRPWGQSLGSVPGRTTWGPSLGAPSTKQPQGPAPAGNVWMGNP